MASVKIAIIVCVLLAVVCGDKIRQSKSAPTCGIDNSPITVVYEGTGLIETYPWLGTLYYPMRGKRFTTSVVLVTTQVVVGSAIDIDKLPKTDFRSRSRVVLGTNCSGPSIGVREYAYHPAYNRTTYSALVLIQLETAYLMQKLRPICPPPDAPGTDPQLYVMALAGDCKDSKVLIHKMKYVSPGKCKVYYEKTGLDVESMWPTHTVCARAQHGRECVWRGGGLLAMRQNNTWSLIGFGVAGPGCRAPARFIDYILSSSWVTHSVARIGRPAVTRIGRNQLVMRRTTSKLQRYGACDPEEIKAELFTDRTTVDLQPKIEMRRIRYNFTILSSMEYSCIVFRVDGQWNPQHESPYIRLRRWCTTPHPVCYSVQYLQVDFYVEIVFYGNMTYNVAAYGEEAKLLDIKKVMKYTNDKRPFPKIEMTDLS